MAVLSPHAASLKILCVHQHPDKSSRRTTKFLSDERVCKLRNWLGAVQCGRNFLPPNRRACAPHSSLLSQVKQERRSHPVKPCVSFSWHWYLQ